MNIDFNFFLGYFNFIVIPFYLVYRYKSNKLAIFLNPLLYLVIASYFYLTISSFFFDSFIEAQVYFTPILGIVTTKSIAVTNLVSNWTVLVFLVFYYFSKDYETFLLLQYKPRGKTYQLALFFCTISALVYILIILFYGPELFTSPRRASLELYADLFRKFRLENFYILLLASSTVLVWRSKSFRWYLVLLIPIIFGFLAKDRDLALQIIIFCYLNFVCLTKKSHFSLLTTCLGFILLFGLVNNFKGSFLPRDYSIYNLLGEFFNTRVTSIIVYKNYLDYGDFFDYIKESILNFFPSILTNFIFEQNTIDYHIQIKDYYNAVGINFGLAGNIVSEALFYGGVSFAFISPFIIGVIFYAINLLKLYRVFPGFVFLCILVAKLYVSMRSSFYDNFLDNIYLMFTYLLWLTLLEGNRRFYRINRKTR